MLTIEFRNKNNEFVKEWPNWFSELIPVQGDTVLLHYGDNNDIEEEHVVTKCIINGLDPDRLVCIID